MHTNIEMRANDISRCPLYLPFTGRSDNLARAFEIQIVLLSRDGFQFHVFRVRNLAGRPDHWQRISSRVSRQSEKPSAAAFNLCGHGQSAVRGGYAARFSDTSVARK